MNQSVVLASNQKDQNKTLPTYQIHPKSMENKAIKTFSLSEIPQRHTKETIDLTAEDDESNNLDLSNTLSAETSLQMLSIKLLNNPSPLNRKLEAKFPLPTRILSVPCSILKVVIPGGRWNAKLKVETYRNGEVKTLAFEDLPASSIISDIVMRGDVILEIDGVEMNLLRRNELEHLLNSKLNDPKILCIHRRHPNPYTPLQLVTPSVFNSLPKSYIHALTFWEWFELETGKSCTKLHTGSGSYPIGMRCKLCRNAKISPDSVSDLVNNGLNLLCSHITTCHKEKISFPAKETVANDAMKQYLTSLCFEIGIVDIKSVRCIGFENVRPCGSPLSMVASSDNNVCAKNNNEKTKEVMNNPALSSSIADAPPVTYLQNDKAAGLLNNFLPDKRKGDERAGVYNQADLRQMDIPPRSTLKNVIIARKSTQTPLTSGYLKLLPYFNKRYAQATLMEQFGQSRIPMGNISMAFIENMKKHALENTNSQVNEGSQGQKWHFHENVNDYSQLKNDLTPATRPVTLNDLLLTGTSHHQAEINQVKLGGLGNLNSRGLSDVSQLQNFASNAKSPHYYDYLEGNESRTMSINEKVSNQGQDIMFQTPKFPSNSIQSQSTTSSSSASGMTMYLKHKTDFSKENSKPGIPLQQKNANNHYEPSSSTFSSERDVSSNNNIMVNMSDEPNTLKKKSPHKNRNDENTKVRTKSLSSENIQNSSLQATSNSVSTTDVSKQTQLTRHTPHPPNSAYAQSASINDSIEALASFRKFGSQPATNSSVYDNSSSKSNMGKGKSLLNSDHKSILDKLYFTQSSKVKGVKQHKREIMEQIPLHENDSKASSRKGLSSLPALSTLDGSFKTTHECVVGDKNISSILTNNNNDVINPVTEKQNHFSVCNESRSQKTKRKSPKEGTKKEKRDSENGKRSKQNETLLADASSISNAIMCSQESNPMEAGQDEGKMFSSSNLEILNLPAPEELKVSKKPKYNENENTALKSLVLSKNSRLSSSQHQHLPKTENKKSFNLQQKSLSDELDILPVHDSEAKPSLEKKLKEKKKNVISMKCFSSQGDNLDVKSGEHQFPLFVTEPHAELSISNCKRLQNTTSTNTKNTDLLGMATNSIELFNNNLAAESHENLKSAGSPVVKKPKIEIESNSKKNICCLNLNNHDIEAAEVNIEKEHAILGEAPQSGKSDDAPDECVKQNIEKALQYQNKDGDELHSAVTHGNIPQGTDSTINFERHSTNTKDSADMAFKIKKDIQKKMIEVEADAPNIKNNHIRGKQNGEQSKTVDNLTLNVAAVKHSHVQDKRHSCVDSVVTQIEHCIMNVDDKKIKKRKRVKNDSLHFDKTGLVPSSDECKSGSQLLFPQDKRDVSEYCFFLLQQIKRCESLSKVGIECKYCSKFPSEIFQLFPASVRRLRKSEIQKMHDHIANKCKRAPAGIGRKLAELKNEEVRHYAKIKPSRQDDFFDRFWKRLTHQECVEDQPKNSPQCVNMKNQLKSKQSKSSTKSEKNFYVAAVESRFESSKTERDSFGEKDNSVSAFDLFRSSKIVEPEDQKEISDYQYFLLQQVQTCLSETFSSSRGSCASHGVGVECKHCSSAPSNFQFYPTSSKRLRTSLSYLHEHFLVCQFVNDDIKQRLVYLRGEETRNFKNFKHSQLDQFFEVLWKRLENISLSTKKASSKVDNSNFTSSLPKSSRPVFTPQRDVEI